MALVPGARPGEPNGEAKGKTEKHSSEKPQGPPHRVGAIGRSHGFMLGGDTVG